MLRILDVKKPICSGCEQKHFPNEPCDIEATQRKMEKMYWTGVLDGGMDRDRFEIAIIKSENAEID